MEFKIISCLTKVFADCAPQGENLNLSILKGETASFQLAAWGAGVIFQQVLVIDEHITTVFVFAVFLIAWHTDGYFYGIAAAILGTFAVNYFFTFPYYALDFLIQSNFFSAVVMTAIALLTSTLTTQIKQTKTMQAEAEKERLRANLLRAVSHDLRTPLTTIYGASSAILDGGENLTAQQQNKMLLGIREDAQELIRMVENLLSVTRIDAPGVTILKTPTALDELLDSVLQNFHKHYPGQRVELTIPEEIVVIPMDAILIQQVLVNLLENAVRHGRDMTRLSLNVTTQAGQAVFEIADNGCGISPERLPHLFTGYFDSLSHPADGQKRNAGIGLSVCASIIKAHGGNITAENAPQGGAVFRFTLNTEDFSDDEQQV
jgi:two-component system sensor histidine kinase KdpD